MENEINIYMGCGKDKREGFLHSDIRKFDHVDYVCKAWELSFQQMEVNHIYSRHMLEHLTNYEADRTLRDWFKALKTDGTIRVIVPNMDFHAKQWLEAEWDEDSLKNKKSDAQHSFAGFWGWQEECDPWNENYNETYWSVHKSGYNEKRIRLLLERIGYTNVNIEIKNDVHLVAMASKPKYSGERQVGKKLDEIRLDHRNRYEFASKLITKRTSLVLDAACGAGYGSYILSKNINIENIKSFDISIDALTHAREYYSSDKIEYARMNLEEEDFKAPSPDYFISFETIEHLPSPEKFIEKISKYLKTGATFIGSTPNEDVIPFIQQNFLFHTRHFTLNQIDEILKKYGFGNIQYYQQNNDKESLLEEKNDGRYIIFVAIKQ